MGQARQEKQLGSGYRHILTSFSVAEVPALCRRADVYRVTEVPGSLSITLSVPSNQGVMLVPAMYPEPRPFVWFPLAGQRHAINRRDHNVPLGSPMRSLCGASHPRGQDGDIEWLWPTCQPCWDETCKIVGIRPRR